MSLILKGIDMPKNDQVIVIHSDGTFNKVDPFARRLMPLYEAIQIPKGHGRLIDADALETIFKDMAKCEWNQRVSPISWAYAFEDTIDEIDSAPTILEAEES